MSRSNKYLPEIGAPIMNVATVSATPPIRELLSNREGHSLSVVTQATVVASPDQSGGTALSVNGKTYEASLPNSLQVGQQLTIKITEIDGGVALEILRVATTTPPNSSVSAEEKILQLLKDLSLIPPTRNEIRQLTQLLQSLSNGLDLGKLIEGGLDREFVLQNFIHSGVLTESKLLSPQLIKEILRATFEGSGDAPPREMVAARLHEVLTTLRTNVQGVFDGSIPFESIEKFSTQILQLHQILTTGQGSSSIEYLLRQLNALNSPTMNLGVQLQALQLVLGEIKSLGILQIPTQSHELMEFARQLMDPNLKGVGLERTMQNISQQLFGETISPRGAGRTAGSPEIRQLQHSLESLAQTQELLQKLNQFMQHLQEPVMVLLPAALKDMFWMWQIRFDGARGDERSGKSRGETYSRFTILLSLPGLGSVEARCAHSDEEALINLKFDDPEKADFVDQFSHYLKGMFYEIGIKQSLIIPRHGTNRGATPGWVKELGGSRVVA